MPDTGSAAMDRLERPRGWLGWALLGHRSVVLATALLVGMLLVGSLPRSAAVVNGSPVSGAPSWAVGLVGKTSGLCSGVLIAPNLVLSAAHCRNDYLKGDISAVIGRSDLLNDRQGSMVGVVSVTGHPSEDLAVYRLARSVSQTPIPISRTHIGDGSRDIPFTFQGYGIQSEPTQPMKIDYLLHSAVGQITSCAGSGAGRIPKPKVCLTSVKIGAPCQGDSGGPIVTPGNELAGIFVGNSGAVNGQPICDGSQWITEPMGDAGINGWVSAAIRQSAA